MIHFAFFQGRCSAFDLSSGRFTGHLRLRWSSWSPCIHPCMQPPSLYSHPFLLLVVLDGCVQQGRIYIGRAKKDASAILKDRRSSVFLGAPNADPSLLHAPVVLILETIKRLQTAGRPRAPLLSIALPTLWFAGASTVARCLAKQVSTAGMSPSVLTRL